jgi:hypothetical protein
MSAIWEGAAILLFDAAKSGISGVRPGPSAANPCIETIRSRRSTAKFELEAATGPLEAAKNDPEAAK